jgi:hypothetical protein
MTNYELRVYNCIEASVHFLQKGEVLPLTPKESSFATPLAAAYAGIKAYLVDQGVGNRGFREGASERLRIVRAIRSLNRRISKIAKSIAEEGVEPGIAEKFRISHKVRTQMMAVSTGLGFAAAAEPIAALFVERGMEPTFVAEMRALVTAYETASGRRVSGLAVQTTGTAGIAQLTREGLRYVRMLRPLLHERLKNDVPMQTAWEMASRVARRGTVETPAAGGTAGLTTENPEGTEVYRVRDLPASQREGADYEVNEGREGDAGHFWRLQRVSGVPCQRCEGGVIGSRAENHGAPGGHGGVPSAGCNEHGGWISGDRVDATDGTTMQQMECTRADVVFSRGTSCSA